MNISKTIQDEPNLSQNIFKPIPRCSSLYIKNYKDLPNDSDIELKIEIPESYHLGRNSSNDNFAHHDYAGALYGYYGTTIRTLEKITKTIIKVDYNTVIIKPRDYKIGFEKNMISLNLASQYIISIMKSKHIENDKQNLIYNSFHKWQINEKKIFDKFNLELEKISELKLDPCIFGNSDKNVLRTSVIEILKKNKEIDESHDSSFLKIFEDFTNMIKPFGVSDYEFKTEFTNYYKQKISKHFNGNNILIRGILLINNRIEINFINYTNFFYEINQFYNDMDTMETDYFNEFLPTTDIDRPFSCMPGFDYMKKQSFSSDRPRSLSNSQLQIVF
jgi:hypothetical protein